MSKDGFIQLPYWPYKVNPETGEVMSLSGRGRILKQRADGSYALNRGGRTRNFTIKRLVACALSGKDPAERQSKAIESNRTRQIPWAILREFYGPDGNKESYYVRLVQGPSILSLPPNIPGVKSWATPEMLGVDAPLLPVGAAGA